MSTTILVTTFWSFFELLFIALGLDKVYRGTGCGPDGDDISALGLCSLIRSADRRENPASRWAR